MASPAVDVVCGVTNGGSAYALGSLFCIFSGIIFDLPDLASRLGLDEPSSSPSGAQLLAYAYRLWGEALTDNIDGEFAFALWDGSARKLILGRDAVARGALFYWTVGDALVFASEPRGLFAFPQICAETDDEAIARSLNTQFQSGRTFFRGVRYPQPAHHVIIQQGKAHRLRKTWSPEDQPQLRLRDLREYPIALHAALLRAVEVRLPPEGVVASQLSSGFDSSGVTALAAQALARQNRSLLAYTSIPTHASDASAVMRGWFSDEWPLAHQVATMYPNIEHIRIPTGRAPWMPSLDDLTEVHGGPPSFIRNVPWVRDLHRQAQADGAVVMFNGQAGNLTSSYGGNYSLFDLRRRHDWRGLAKAIAWRRQQGVRWRGLLMRTWMPTGSTRSLIRRLRGRKLNHFYDASLMRPEFYRSTGIPELLESPLGNPIDGDRRNSAAWRLSTLRLIDLGAATAGDQRLFHMRREDPTSDRRVIELCMSIPDEVFLMGNAPRDLYRDAMKATLPSELLQAKGGGLQSSDFLENFRDGLHEFQEEMQLLHQSPSANRVLDLPRMQTMLESFPADLTTNRGELDLRYNYTFGGAIAMGRFLRKLESGQLDWVTPPSSLQG
jgi:asparagine synthase (glutamine-hydrolysing)